MKARTLVTPCHVRVCDRAAAVVCASCGRNYCASHSGVLSIERRAEGREARSHPWRLEHVPTYTEAFTLCLRCSKRPLLLTHRQR